MRQGTSSDLWIRPPPPTAEEQAHAQRTQFYENYDWAQELREPYATFAKDNELFCLLCGVRTEAHFSGRQHKTKVINSPCCEQDFSSWAYPDIETYEDCVADKAEAEAEAEAAREEVKQAEAEAQAETEAWDAWLKQEARDEAEAWSEYHEEPQNKTRRLRSPS